MIGKTISHYTILEELGEGGMGVVYRAHDVKLDRDVAIKFLSPQLLGDEQSRARLEAEARAASALDHPNVCTVYDYGDSDGQPFLVFALIDGDTLEARLAGGPLSIDQTVETARQIARGLDAAHDKGITHRDLKPSNIMIDRHGVVKIMDFGLARREGKAHLTRTGTTLGTLPYMSPEQVRGSEVDCRTDLWSLGIIICEMMTGKRPFPGDYDAALMYQILNEHPEGVDSIQEVSPPLATLIGSLLEKDPEHRTQSAVEVLDQLKKIHSGEVSLQVREAATHQLREKPGSSTRRMVREIRRRRLVPIVGIYILTAMGLLQGGSYLIERVGLDNRWHEILLIWVVCGLPLAALAGYYHGMRGPSRIRQLEAGLISIVLLIATGASIWSWRTSPYVATLAESPFPEPVSSIAVMYFEDNTGDQQTKWLSKGLPHMLITSLEQIPELQVVGYQRLHDILKELAKENTEAIDKSTATAVAKTAGVKTMLLGSIFKWGDRFRVDYQLQDVKEGQLITAEKVDGDDPFKLADAIALGVRKHLRVASSVPGKSVADVTTNSLEAYRHYIKANELRSGGLWKDSWASYTKAVQEDSTFAIAYLEMYWIALNSGFTIEVADSLLDMAVRYAPQTSAREGLFIRAAQAEHRGELEKWRLLLETLVEQYPMAGDACEELGNYHHGRREFTKALQYLQKSATLSNYGGQTVLLMADALARLGQFDSAYTLVQKYAPESVKAIYEVVRLFRNRNLERARDSALQLTSDYGFEPWSHKLLGLANLLLEQFGDAESSFRSVDSLGWAGEDIPLVVATRLYQGKHKEALNYCQQKRRTGVRRTLRIACWQEIQIHSLQGDLARAAVTWRRFRPFMKETLGRRQRGDTYVADSLCWMALEAMYTGDLASAAKYSSQAAQEIDAKNLGGDYRLTLAGIRGELELHSNNFTMARRTYEYLVQEEANALRLYCLAECLCHLQDYQAARLTLQRIDITREPDLHRADASFGYSFPRKYYLLGKVNEALGEKQEAVKAYQELLRIWKNADTDLPELIETKERLTRLTEG